VSFTFGGHSYIIILITLGGLHQMQAVQREFWVPTEHSQISLRFLTNYTPKAGESESGGRVDNFEMNWRALSLHYDQLLHAICCLLSARSFA
jgi:hypothetical protein